MFELFAATDYTNFIACRITSQVFLISVHCHLISLSPALSCNVRVINIRKLLARFRERA